MFLDDVLTEQELSDTNAHLREQAKADRLLVSLSELFDGDPWTA